MNKISVLIGALLAAGIITDERSKAMLDIFLSKPVSPRRYFLVKLMAAAAVVIVIYLAAVIAGAIRFSYAVKGFGLADIVGILKRRLLVCDSLQNLQTGAGLSVPVEIEIVEPLDDYRAVIMELPIVSSIEQSGTIFQIEVMDARENIPRLVRTLAERGMKIISVRPRMQSLENVYLKCVRWGDNGVQDQ
jgi:hypothetical protein